MTTTKHWHTARGAAAPIARVRHTNYMEQPGPLRGSLYPASQHPYRGTVSVYGLQGVGPAAYHFQHHHAVYPDERRRQNCCEPHPHYRHQHRRMETWNSATLLSYLYHSERRNHRW